MLWIYVRQEANLPQLGPSAMQVGWTHTGPFQGSEYTHQLREIGVVPCPMLPLRIVLMSIHAIWCVGRSGWVASTQARYIHPRQPSHGSTSNPQSLSMSIYHLMKPPLLRGSSQWQPSDQAAWELGDRQRWERQTDRQAGRQADRQTDR